jgi:hypothetical protein
MDIARDAMDVVDILGDMAVQVMNATFSWTLMDT